MNNLLDYLKRIKPTDWLKGCLYELLLSIVYQSAFRQLIINDWAKEDYSHCMLIPLCDPVPAVGKARAGGKNVFEHGEHPGFRSRILLSA